MPEYRLYEIVMKIVGPVQPIGESNADRIRLKNMGELTELIDYLLSEVREAESSADRIEASMKLIGCHARNFLKEVKSA